MMNKQYYLLLLSSFLCPLGASTRDVMQAQPIISTATGLPLESLPFMKLGVYRHYKGGMYRLIAVVRHTETEEAMVVYAPLGGGDAWARPYKMFVESTEYQNRIVPRFEWVSAE